MEIQPTASAIGARVRRFEDQALTAPQVDLETRHLIGAGLYVRSVMIRAGGAITGAAHRKPHVCITRGDIVVTTDDGPKRLTGMHEFSVEPGSKRAGVAIEDTIWTTVTRTDLTDLALIEAELFDEPERLQTRTARDWFSLGFIRQDYRRFLEEYGLDADQVQAISRDMGDHVAMPEKANIVFGESEIAGLGAFAKVELKKGFCIGWARLSDRRTFFGRTINHSPIPNCFAIADEDGDLMIAAKRVIQSGGELTIDYRQMSFVGRKAEPINIEACRTLWERACHLRARSQGWATMAVTTFAELLVETSAMVTEFGYLPSIDDIEAMQSHSVVAGSLPLMLEY
jgi:hypothetical protein